MYYPNHIEELCYEQFHIDKVWEEMEKVIPLYFKKMIETEDGHSIESSEIEKLAAKFGASVQPKSKPKDGKKVLERIVRESIESFEKERKIYQETFDLEALEEYGADVGSFKRKILKDLIPIIRKTLQNRHATELDKFREAFALSQPGDLFKATSNIIKLANEWRYEWYDGKEFENINTLDDLNYGLLDEEEYTVRGVIGGGIRSHFIYKLHPEMYPWRSREAVWALYYLSNKKAFGCNQDSEFLMINKEKGTTHQNYFYPYALFSFYALRVMQILKKLYGLQGVSFPIEYRFVIVNSFFAYIAQTHEKEIEVLKRGSNDESYDY